MEVTWDRGRRSQVLTPVGTEVLTGVCRRGKEGEGDRCPAGGGTWAENIWSLRVQPSQGRWRPRFQSDLRGSHSWSRITRYF